MATRNMPLAPHPVWLSHSHLAVLGTGIALPGPPAASDALIDRITHRFAVPGKRRAQAIAQRLAIETRHLCRDFEAGTETARPGHANPDLAAQAVTCALAEAGLKIDDIAYLIGHTATPLQPLPANIALAADRLGYRGPHLELRQACTGFANALMIAFGLLSVPGARPIAIVGSETGSLFFGPHDIADDPGSSSTWSRWATARGRSGLAAHPDCKSMLLLRAASIMMSRASWRRVRHCSMPGARRRCTTA